MECVCVECVWSVCVCGVCVCMECVCVCGVCVCVCGVCVCRTLSTLRIHIALGGDVDVCKGMCAWRRLKTRMIGFRIHQAYNVLCCCIFNC